MARDYEIAFRLQAQMNAQFRNSFRDANRQLEEMQRTIRELQNARGPDRAANDAERGFRRANNTAGKFGSTVTTLAKFTGLTAIVAGVIAGLKKTIGLVDDLDNSMRQFQASTNVTDNELKGIKQQASSLYRDNLGENWDDLTRSMATVRQVTGLTGDALKVATRDAIVYRDVFGEDVTASIRAADQMTRQFGISQHESFNLLAQGYKDGLNMSDELIDSVSEYSVYFKKLGYNANDMFNMFGAGASEGVFQLDKIGDSIKELTIRTKDQSKTTYEGYKVLGLNAKQMEQAVANGGEAGKKAVQQIFQQLAKIEDPVKRNIAGVSLFGTQFEDLEYEAIKAMGEARNQFDSTRETMNNVKNVKYGSISKSFQAIGRSIQMDMVIPMSQYLLPYVSKFAEFFTSGKLSKMVGGTFKAIGGFISGIFEGGGEGAAFTELTESVLYFRDMVVDTFKEMRPYIMNTINSIGKIIKAGIPIFKTVASTVAKMAATVIRVLAPIVTYLASKIWPIVSKVFGWLANDVAPMVVSAIQTMAPAFQKTFNKIVTAVGAIFERMKPVIDGIVEAFNFAFPYIQQIVSDVIGKITGIFNALMQTIGGIVDFITGVFTGNWSQAWDGVVEIFGGIWSGLRVLVAGPINAVIGMVNKAIGKINSISVDLPFDMGHIGFSIPTIPEIPAYAKGGFTDGPSLAGEKGMEAVIPIDGSKRSKRLYEQTGNMLGINSGGGDTYHINVTVPGSTTPEQAREIGFNVGAAVEQVLKQNAQRRMRVSLG
ncbi:Phage-related minor tail protein [compost metagenome]